MESCPEEVLDHLCSSLTEEDVNSLSATSPQLNTALNHDTAWRQFVRGVNILESLTQLVDPPFQPDPNICKARQHLMRRDHLISNWKNGNFAQRSAGNSRESYNYEKTAVWTYKEKYMIIQYTQNVQFWDISETPVLLSSTCMSFFNSTRVRSKVQMFVINDFLVVADSCIVDVHRINTEDKSFSRLFSFSIVENEIVRDKRAPHTMRLEGRSLCCEGWEIRAVENYLVCVKNNYSLDTNPVLHVWNIENARKVGTFVTPFSGRLTIFHSVENKELVLQTLGERNDSYFFKFDLATEQFFEAQFTFRTCEHHNNIVFHKNRCIIFKCDQDVNRGSLMNRGSLICEVFDFKTSKKLKERHFQNIDFLGQEKTVVDGKIVLFNSEGFLVVNALNLETMFTIPFQLNIKDIVSNIRVFGSNFLASIEENGCLKIWDLEKKESVVSLEDVLPPRRAGLLESKYLARRLHKSVLSSKLVIFGAKEVLVLHFW